ncbi:MAG: hypothetical protein CMN60_20815 [Sphingobium sp.]|nr:hypothetical protein [Sphingobium sp.]MBS50090.1 hypothetical protein [Sphingobium sp.]
MFIKTRTTVEILFTLFVTETENRHLLTKTFMLIRFLVLNGLKYQIQLARVSKASIPITASLACAWQLMQK